MESSSTVTVDNTDANAAPTITAFSLSDRTNPAWERFDIDWAVSDADGNLSQVSIEMLDASGGPLDAAQASVSGSNASGSDQVKTKGDGAEIVLTATDATGSSTSDAKPI